MGLKSASLMLVLLRESGLRKSGFLDSLGVVPGRLPRIGVPWGMLPEVRGEAGSPIGLAPGSLVPMPGPLPDWPWACCPDGLQDHRRGPGVGHRNRWQAWRFPCHQR